MIYKSQLTKRIMNKLEKYGVHFYLHGTFSIKKFNVHCFGHDNPLGYPLSALWCDESEYDMKSGFMINFEFEGEKNCCQINFYEPIALLVRKDVELDVFFSNIEEIGRSICLEVYGKYEVK